MELFSIHCTTCRVRLKVKDESVIGSILNCPKCGSMVQIVPPVGWRRPGDPTGGAGSDPAGSSSGLSIGNSASHIGPLPTTVSTGSTPVAPSLSGTKLSATVPPTLPTRGPTAATPARANTAPQPSTTSSAAAPSPVAQSPANQSPATLPAAPVPAVPNTLPEATAESSRSPVAAAWPAALLARAKTDWALLVGGLAVGVVAGATAWLVIRAGSSGPAVAVDDRPQTHVATPQAAELPADEDVDTLPATSSAEQTEPAPNEGPTAERAATSEPPDQAADKTPVTASSAVPTAAPTTAEPPRDAAAPASTTEEPASEPSAGDDEPAAANEPSIKLDPAEPAAPISTSDEATDAPVSAGQASAADVADDSAEQMVDDALADDAVAGADEQGLTQERVDQRMSVPLGEVRFVGATLAQFVDFIADVTALRISIDDAALAKAGKKRTMPVSVHLSGTTAHDALHAALAPLGLSCVIHGNRLMITVDGR